MTDIQIFQALIFCVMLVACIIGLVGYLKYGRKK